MPLAIWLPDTPSRSVTPGGGKERGENEPLRHDRPHGHTIVRLLTQQQISVRHGPGWRVSGGEGGAGGRDFFHETPLID